MSSHATWWRLWNRLALPLSIVAVVGGLAYQCETDPVRPQPPLRAVLKGHPGPILCLAYSLDGTTLVSGGSGDRVMLWDPATGHLNDTFVVRADVTTSLAFAPDGKTLATGGIAPEGRVWDLATGKIRLALSAEPAAGRRVVRVTVFASDGKTLAAGGVGGELWLWDPATGQKLFALVGHTADIQCLAFAPDGKTLASGGNDATDPALGPGNRAAAGRAPASPGDDPVPRFRSRRPDPCHGKSLRGGNPALGPGHRRGAASRSSVTRGRGSRRWPTHPTAGPSPREAATQPSGSGTRPRAQRRGPAWARRLRPRHRLRPRRPHPGLGGR